MDYRLSQHARSFGTDITTSPLLLSKFSSLTFRATDDIYLMNENASGIG